MNLKRSSGILLHPTSLPGSSGIGSLGIEAYRFVDFLASAGQSVWQILPLGPTGYGNSPYSAFSAFAGNPLLICLERLVEAGDLDLVDLEGIAMPEGEVNFDFARSCKWRLLHKAAGRFRQHREDGRRSAFEEFCRQQAGWLADYALFRELHNHFREVPWNKWPDQVRRREENALRTWAEEMEDALFVQKYAQFVFFEQWFALKQYANASGIKIFGDLPIFVAYDSADVWANPHLFHLDDGGRPTHVAGVPPDYFSATGQRWGNPLYNWEAVAADDYRWWLDRFHWNLTQADLVRIDHFRGFEACWTIPAEEPTAVKGHWEPVPGEDLFRALQEEMGDVPVVAEDLGLITPEVEQLRDRCGFPGMKILQFAFDSGPDNPYLPHNLHHHCLVYTGTHDNDTTLGWWQGLNAGQRKAVEDYLGTDRGRMPDALIRAALASVADLAIIPLQDILALDDRARMNRPGSAKNNWSWRFGPKGLTETAAASLRRLTEIYGRLP